MYLLVVVVTALTNTAVGGAMGNPIGAIALGVAIGVPVNVAWTRWVWRRFWPDELTLPRARVSKIADPRLDIGPALKRGDRTWRP